MPTDDNDIGRCLFHRAHYNIIAKQIRELFAIDDPFETSASYHAAMRENRNTLSDLAINLANRFMIDNPRFDPIKFLEACSPDNDRYPLTELWKG